jgi:hypothetical protein
MMMNAAKWKNIEHISHNKNLSVENNRHRCHHHSYYYNYNYKHCVAGAGFTWLPLVAHQSTIEAQQDSRYTRMLQMRYDSRWERSRLHD